MSTQQLLQLCWVTELEGLVHDYCYCLLQSAVHASGYRDGLSSDV